jgi:ankyrin repeat protein
MRSKKQKSLNSVKHSLKKDGDFRKYKHLFKNKQVRFLFSKMSIIFESTISSQDLTSVEKSLLDNPTQENFITSLIELSKTFDAKFINLK